MRRLALLIAAAGLFASPAFAQSTYPTVSGPRVNGVVPLQCDVNGANCAPIASANPAPTGTGTAATQVQGTAAHDAAYVGNPIGNGCYASSTAPTAVQAGDAARSWCGLAGNGIVSIASGSGSSIVYASGYSASISTSQIALATFAGLYAYDGANMLRMPGDANGLYIHGTPQSTITDGSGTVTTGGTSQQVFAAATTRLYLMCQNPIAASETLFINIGAAASTTAGSSYELAPGGSITFSGAGMIPTGTVNVTAATTAHKFICKAG